MIRRSAPFALAAAVLCSSLLPAHAKWARITEDMPLERVVPNVQRYINQNSQDASGYYVLGRIHSVAWAQGSGNIALVAPTGQEKLPGFARYESVLVHGEEGKLTEDARKHLLESIWYYQAAVRLEPKNALYQLGLGWMAEQAMKYSPGETGRIAYDWKSLAVQANTQAFALTRLADKDKNGFGPAADSSISLEAAEALVRLLPPATTPALRAELAEYKSHIVTMSQKGRAVTPIIIPLQGENSLEALLSPGTTVNFDLGGTERGEKWDWVAPGTGILVWDPQRTGRVTSGRQLFGSATWWMFWKDGYQALNALDNDGNGQLEGSELAGLSIWRDANQNGVSDLGEVKPVAEWGIQALGVKSSQALPDGSLVSSSGVRWSNGRVSASYDWLARSR